MKVILRHRNHGLHENVKEAVLPGTFGDYAVPKDEEFSTPDDWRIDEDKLIAALPEGFLPVPPYRILLAVEDEFGGTGQVGLSRFRNWAKYFDAYCLNLVKTEEPEKESPAEAAQAVSKAREKVKLKPVIEGVKRDAEMMAAVHAAIAELVALEDDVKDEEYEEAVERTKAALGELDYSQLKEAENAAIALSMIISDLCHEKEEQN